MEEIIIGEEAEGEIGGEVKDRNKIIGASLETIHRAVETFPSEICDGFLQFRINNLECPIIVRDMDGYMKKCDEKGVLPFSQHNLKFNIEKGFFVHSKRCPFEISVPDIGDYLSKTMDMVSEPRKPYAIRYEFNENSRYFSPKALSYIRDKRLIQTLSERDYSLVSGMCVINRNDFGDLESGLRISGGGNLELVLNRSLNTKEAISLVRWFDDLKKKNYSKSEPENLVLQSD